MSINTVQVDSILERLALQDAFRFNAYQVASLSHEIDIEMVNNYMLFKAQFGVLEARLEFLCPNNHPDFQIQNGMPVPKVERECRICDEQYIPDLESSHIVFYFQPSFIKEVKKKHQLSHQEKQAI